MPVQIPKISTGFIGDLRSANSVTVLTGAGVSVGSGIPTFRDSKNGLWEKYNAQELATPAAFQKDPELVWNWYRWRRELINRAQPNPGHLAIREMEKRFPNFQVITQNMDGLHQAAGNQNVIELHGNIHRHIAPTNRSYLNPGQTAISPFQHVQTVESLYARM